MATFTRSALLALALMFAAGCDILGTDPPATIGVHNTTDVSVLVLLLEAEVAATVDPSPVLTPEAGDPAILAAGGFRAFPIAEVMGDFVPGRTGLVAFIYHVQGAEATYAGHLSFTSKQLDDQALEITIEELWPQTY